MLFNSNSENHLYFCPNEESLFVTFVSFRALRLLGAVAFRRCAENAKNAVMKAEFPNRVFQSS